MNSRFSSIADLVFADHQSELVALLHGDDSARDPRTSPSSPEVGFGDIAIDVSEARLLTARHEAKRVPIPSGLPKVRKSL